MKKLVEKPFAIFGRTGTGKSILNKLVCAGILSKDVGSVLIFDMHGEYGVFSATDKTEGLKFFFPGKVEIFSLDPKNREAKPFVLDTGEITPEDLIVALQDLTTPMVDTLYEIAKSRGGRDLISAVKDATMEMLGWERAHEMTLQGLKRRIGRLDRLPFLKAMTQAKDAFAYILGAIRDGKSVVLDFGDYGTDQMVYLFVANILSRRLFELYTERNEEYPRLVLFLEEAHKFLSPEIAPYAHTFSRLARETRKFNLILALVDQRPSRISDEVRSQLANRLVMSLKEPSDVEAALAGVPDKKMWENIIAKLPLRTVAVIGDAIRIPTVIDVLSYDDLNVRQHILGAVVGYLFGAALGGDLAGLILAIVGAVIGSILFTKLVKVALAFLVGLLAGAAVYGLLGGRAQFTAGQLDTPLIAAILVLIVVFGISYYYVDDIIGIITAAIGGLLLALGLYLLQVVSTLTAALVGLGVFALGAFMQTAGAPSGGGPGTRSGCGTVRRHRCGSRLKGVCSSTLLSASRSMRAIPPRMAGTRTDSTRRATAPASRSTWTCDRGTSVGSSSRSQPRGGGATRSGTLISISERWNGTCVTAEMRPRPRGTRRARLR